MPVLGICRGMQMLNVAWAARSTSTSRRLGHDEHRHTPGVFTDHGVRLAAGLARRAGGGLARRPR